MSSITAHIQQTVSPQTYWESVFPDMKWPPAGIEPRLKCPWRDDKNPSLTVNRESGAWCDHGGDDKDSGKSIVSFHARLMEMTNTDAAADLYGQFVHPIIEDKQVRKWHRQLMATPSAVEYIRTKRLVADNIIEQFQLGIHGERIAFPIRNEFGLFVNAKLYKPGGKPKMLSYKNPKEARSYGSPTMLYPLSVMTHTTEEDPIVLCEGEWDALALLSLGIMAVTGTTGVKSWPVQYTELFRGRTVIIAYDNDEDGMKYDQRAMKALAHVAKTVKRLTIPAIKWVSGVVKDVTDWMFADRKMRVRDSWLEVIDKATVMVDNPDSYIEETDIIPVALDQASRAEYYGKRIRVDALVTGKDTAPYILPKRFRVTCSRECEECPLSESNRPFREKIIDPCDPSVLDMIDSPKPQLKRTLLSIAGMPAKPTCRSQCEVIETFNLEQLLLIPSLDSKSSQYVMRPSYYVGHGLHSNRTYRFEGTTTPDPQDQHATHLFTHAKPVQDEIETFELTDVMKTKLRRFQIKGNAPTARLVTSRLYQIAEWQSRNVSKILDRPDLHIAVDLVFHSANSFEFNQEKVKRGMLDVLILGDTRCGKGYVAEGLVKYYGLGEVASGENCSFAGLVGGCESIGKRFIVKWGIIPLNNGRLVVIDEASALSEQEFGHMSRVRSEGVAEISKIVREQTQANTRLLWLSNPRSGRPIMSYNAGVLAIKELVGANEDISRFDYAVTVAHSEVDSDTINTVSRAETHDADKYPADICRALVLWAWSREAKDIVFTDSATETIIESAKELGRTYNAAIPLVQSENVRIKVAKIAVAIAARVFSTDETCRQLIVDRAHVEAACHFLRTAYDKNSMGYDTYSQAANERTVIGDEAAVSKTFEQVGESRVQTIKGLLALSHITGDTLADYIGDLMSAKALLSDLVQLGCVTRYEKGNWYMKNQSFTAWLREQQRKHNNK